jgi:hypothetical protein
MATAIRTRKTANKISIYCDGIQQQRKLIKHSSNYPYAGQLFFIENFKPKTVFFLEESFVRRHSPDGITSALEHCKPRYRFHETFDLSDGCKC